LLLAGLASSPLERESPFLLLVCLIINRTVVIDKEKVSSLEQHTVAVLRCELGPIQSTHQNLQQGGIVKELINIATRRSLLCLDSID
jgi:hypothetical protein